MRAVVCKEFGPPRSLVVEEVPDPKVKPGHVRIDVHAAGVNFPDVLIIQDKYQFKPPLPFTPGGEVAGVIREVGEGVSDFAAGDRVLASTGWGGFAEALVIDRSRVFRIPDQMDFPAASALLMTYGTSHYALKDRAGLQPGETLAVLGAAGGVGLAAVELGKQMGARVIACASSDEKIAVCREHGADEGINYTREDLKERLKVLTEGRGVDVVYDPVGGPFSEPALRSTAWEGRFLVIGFAAGDIPRLPLNLTLLKGCSIVGVFWGAFTGKEPARNRANIEELMQWYIDGRIRPYVSATYPLEDVASALEAMERREVKGKVVLTTGR
jgi:NADPH:quinone reductase